MLHVVIKMFFISNLKSSILMYHIILGPLFYEFESLKILLNILMFNILMCGQLFNVLR